MAAALADLLREHATAAGVPGAVIGVLHQGRHEVACHGVADVRTGAAVTASTPFAVGSLTKSMVATVVAGLAAEGRVGLDEPVSAYVREVRTLSWARNSTVRSLLANRSGLPLSVATEFDFEGRPEDDAAALGRLVADLGLEAPPVDDRSLLVDPSDTDNPTVTFGSFDDAGRPGTLYEMVCGLPRTEGA